VNKRAIVTDSRRPAKGALKPRDPEGTPHPLVGAEFITGAAQASQLPPPTIPEIAFAGRSNAGKSSAINALAARTRLAFASRTPGRTQQINLFSLRGGTALIADLPGYGYAAVAREIKRGWQDFLWQYVTTRPSLTALVLVVDSRHGLKQLDLDVLGEFVPSSRPILILATKADKLNTTGQRTALATIESQLREAFPTGTPQITVQLFSASSRIGVEAAEATIAAWIPAPEFPVAGDAAVAAHDGATVGDGAPPAATGTATDGTKERPRGQGE
jgi:GTP-binding protein